MVRRLALLGVVCLYGAAGSHANAQHFGRNKVEYVAFDFQIFATEHFDIYHYASEKTAATLAGRLAERWYARFARILDHELRGRQPLILYGSHPEFSQTNVVSSFVAEGTGGVTEGNRRRIVMPLAPTLAETDRVLGHEIAHAFQFDLIKRHGGRLGWPLWCVEGMAQYLSLGPADAETAMWLRDAVAHDLVPRDQQRAARAFSPYRYGHAMWAWLTGRFGDRVMGDLLRAGRAGSFDRRLRKVTGAGLDELFAEWRNTVYSQHARDADAAGREDAKPLLRGSRTGRVHLGPALSPDGRSVSFFSERDRLSLDLYLADTDRGAITRKLATTAASARFESLQAIRSAAAWSASGSRLAFAAVQQGRPVLIVRDLDRPTVDRTIRFPTLGQILTPAWSPDGRALAFSAVAGGVTNLYTYDLEDGTLRQVTDDAFADLHPAWSPDGRYIAFATERFSSDLSSLRFGPCRLGLVDVASGSVRPLPALEAARHVSPQWSGDGESLYFVADPGGIGNVFRLAIETGVVFRITDERGGVAGLTPTSPALSVAARAPVLAVTSYRKGRYELEVRRGESRLAGTPIAADTALAGSNGHASDRLVEQLLYDSRFGLPREDAWKARAYAPELSLEAIGQPYVSSGGGPFGTFVRGGGALFFGDLLGGRKLSASVQIGNRLRDLALGVYFLNRERRWNWGALAELEPSIRRLPQTRQGELDGQPTLTSQTHYFERMQLRAAGLVAYPLNQAQRIELSAGIRHARYRQEVRSTVRSLTTGRILSKTETEGPGGAPATVGEIGVAFVGDTAVLGPTGPILGSRYRVEVAPAIGDLSLARMLIDYRRYMMPLRPYTVATRFVHLGHYGRDASDPRLLPAFLGSRQFVRGYSWGSLRCTWNAEGECPALEELLGSRVSVGNVELRVPLRGLLSRELSYGPLPTEAFVFADGGIVWSRPDLFTIASGRRVVTSVGAGVRVNALGLPFELAAVRALDAPARGWSFDFSFRPGF